LSELYQKLEAIRSTSDEAELLKYSQSPYPAVALELARHKGASERVLDNLKHHSSVIVRHALAQNQNVAEQTLKMLSDDKDQLVRDYARMTLQLKTGEEYVYRD